MIKKDEKIKFPDFVETYLFNHQIGITEVKPYIQLVYLKGTNGHTYRFYTKAPILEGFIDGNWKKLSKDKETEDIRLF